MDQVIKLFLSLTILKDMLHMLKMHYWPHRWIFVRVESKHACAVDGLSLVALRSINQWSFCQITLNSQTNRRAWNRSSRKETSGVTSFACSVKATALQIIVAHSYFWTPARLQRSKITCSRSHWSGWPLIHWQLPNQCSAQQQNQRTEGSAMSVTATWLKRSQCDSLRGSAILCTETSKTNKGVVIDVKTQVGWVWQVSGWWCDVTDGSEKCIELLRHGNMVESVSIAISVKQHKTSSNNDRRGLSKDKWMLRVSVTSVIIGRCSKGYSCNWKCEKHQKLANKIRT